MQKKTAPGLIRSDQVNTAVTAVVLALTLDVSSFGEPEGLVYVFRQGTFNHPLRRKRPLTFIAKLTEGFEKDILSQALAANGGNAAATARALKTTPRIVAYKARKYGLLKTRGLCYNIRHAEGNADIRPQRN